MTNNRDHYMAYMRGFSDGAGILAIRKEFAHHATLASTYHEAYEDGCIARGEASQMASARFGYSPTIFRTPEPFTTESEPRQTIDAPKPSTIELRASAHVAMRKWLESEFGADELHEQRIVDMMKAIREQIELAAQQPKIVAPPGFGHSFSCDCDECRSGSDPE